MNGIRILTAIAGLAFVAGCTCPQPVEGPRQVQLYDVEPGAAIDAAREALAAMHFEIETLDAEAGVIRTRPLTGGQFFEVWRSDSVGCFNSVESTLHSTRRTVEMSFRGDGRDTQVICEASLERLSLPGHDIRDVGSLPSAFSRSSGGLLTIRLYPHQQRQLAWVPVASDGLLAERILDRLQQRIDEEAGQ